MGCELRLDSICIQYDDEEQRVQILIMRGIYQYAPGVRGKSGEAIQHDIVDKVFAFLPALAFQNDKVTAKMIEILGRNIWVLALAPLKTATAIIAWPRFNTKIGSCSCLDVL